MSITITNKKICDFYKKYPDINIENLLCNFIDLIEKFAGNYSNISEERIINSIDSITSTLKNDFKDTLKSNFYETKSEITDFKSNIKTELSIEHNKSKEDTIQQLSKIIETNKTMVLKDNELNYEKMKHVIPPEILDAMKDFFSKNKTASNMGSHSENKMETILNKLFTSGEIINTSKEAHAGDLHLKRHNKDTILIENKNYFSGNVEYASVEKFKNDCLYTKQHGIMFSQNSGISTKEDWTIEIINNNILLYLSNVKYDTFKILSAVSLIDNLSIELKKINCSNKDNINCITIDQETMMEINEDIKKFLNSKTKALKINATNEKNMREALEEIQLSSLTKFFAGKCDAIKAHICPFCSSIWTTEASFSAHKRQCHNNPDKKNKTVAPKKPKKEIENICISIETNDSSED